MTDDLAERSDDIWHRALGGEPASRLPGDVAVCAVLLFHGTTMNGGVLNAVESNDDTFVVAAMDGYRWLGLTDIADLVADLRRAVASGEAEDLERAESLEVESDHRYDRSVPDDAALFETVQRRVASTPEAFVD